MTYFPISYSKNVIDGSLQVVFSDVLLVELDFVAK